MFSFPLIVAILLCIGCSSGLFKDKEAKRRVAQESGHHLKLKRDFMIVGGENVSVGTLNISSYAICYVNVLVTISNTNSRGLQGALVTIVSYSGNNYASYSKQTTDSNGLACVAVKCYERGLIFVENKGERLFAHSVHLQRSSLPPRFYVLLRANNEELIFYSFAFGTVSNKTGPVYTNAEKNRCFRSTSNNYHFVFSYISIPDQLVSTPVPTKSTDPRQDNRTWLYGMDGDREFCYMKIKITATESQIKVLMRSVNSQTGELLGLFISGPKYNTDNSTTKAACMMFRCPTTTIEGKTMNTAVFGELQVPDKDMGCCLRGNSLPEDTLINATSTHFWAVFVNGWNYGPDNGVYKANSQSNARARCFTGRDFLGSNYSMSFDNSNALEYDCTVKHCSTNAITIG